MFYRGSPAIPGREFVRPIDGSIPPSEASIPRVAERALVIIQLPPFRLRAERLQLSICVLLHAARRKENFSSHQGPDLRALINIPGKDRRCGLPIYIPFRYHLVHFSLLCPACKLGAVWVIKNPCYDGWLPRFQSAGQRGFSFSFSQQGRYTYTTCQPQECKALRRLRGIQHRPKAV